MPKKPYQHPERVAGVVDAPDESATVRMYAAPPGTKVRSRVTGGKIYMTIEGSFFETTALVPPTAPKAMLETYLKPATISLMEAIGRSFT